MGVTIHYSGRAKSAKAVEQIMHIVTNAAAEWEWPCAQVFDPSGEIHRMTREPGDPDYNEFEADSDGLIDIDDESAGVETYEGPVHTLVAQPLEGCEPFRLGFDRDHRMDGSTKTQYGPVEAHIRICALLRSIERHFETLEVHDESGFYETDDRAALEERLNSFADTQEAAIARYEAAKRKKALEDMYKIGDDEDSDS
jgi:hypothetical protein